VEHLVSLTLLGGAAEYVSDLKPVDYEFTSFWGNYRWPYRLDAGAGGDEMALGGNVYDRGVGMHAASKLTFDLAGKYRYFDVLAGLDDRLGRRGRVVLDVLVDGKSRDVLNGGELGHRDGPVRLWIDVRGGQTLTLVVRFGQTGDTQAHVNWADARLIK
jgi:hypothetical protein